MEQWDVLDSLRNSTGRTVVRGQSMAKSDFHLIIHAWIRRKSDGKFLISRRAPSIFWGGYWQPTGGSAVAGESSEQAAIREVQEELGIQLLPNTGKLIFTYRFTPLEADNPSFFLDAWLFEIDDVQTVHLQKDEVNEAGWSTIEGVIIHRRNRRFMPFDQTWLPYFSVLQHSIQFPQTVLSARFWGTEEIRQSISASPELDASILLAYCMKTDKTTLAVDSRRIVPLETLNEYAKLLFRRSTGEPVAYITGKKSFWMHDFTVSRDVLIPKPDTELLVEQAISEIRSRLVALYGDSEDATDKPLRIVDICTGSGCIAVSVYAEIRAFCIDSGYPIPEMTATDISPEALKIAKKNADIILGSDKNRIQFVQGNLFEPFKTMQNGEDIFDIVLSNPPYVPTNLAHELLKDGRQEPLLALDGGTDGLLLIRKFIPQVWKALSKNGILLLETGEYNAQSTRTLLSQQGFCMIRTDTDLGGQPRLTRAIKP